MTRLHKTIFYFFLCFIQELRRCNGIASQKSINVVDITQTNDHFYNISMNYTFSDGVPGPAFVYFFLVEMAPSNYKNNKNVSHAIIQWMT